MLLPRDEDNPFMVDESGDPKRDSLTQYDFGASGPPAAAEQFPGAPPPGAAPPPHAAMPPRMPAGYEPDDSCGQKCCHVSRRFFEKPVVVVVILAGLAASSLGLFITSIIQSESIIGYTNCPADCTATTCARIVLGDACSDVCSSDAYVAISPVRFAYKKFPDDTLSCGWTTHPNAWRMTLTSVCLLLIAAAAWLVFKRKHGWMVWITVVSVVVAILTFISACVDANAVRQGSKACNDGFSDEMGSHVDQMGGVECHNWPYGSTVMWNYFHSLLWGLMAYSMLVHRNMLDRQLHG